MAPVLRQERGGDGRDHLRAGGAAVVRLGQRGWDRLGAAERRTRTGHAWRAITTSILAGADADADSGT